MIDKKHFGNKMEKLLASILFFLQTILTFLQRSYDNFFEKNREYLFLSLSENFKNIEDRIYEKIAISDGAIVKFHQIYDDESYQVLCRKNKLDFFNDTGAGKTYEFTSYDGSFTVFLNVLYDFQIQVRHNEEENDEEENDEEEEKKYIERAEKFYEGSCPIYFRKFVDCMAAFEIISQPNEKMSMVLKRGERIEFECKGSSDHIMKMFLNTYAKKFTLFGTLEKTDPLYNDEFYQQFILHPSSYEVLQAKELFEFKSK